MEMEKMTENTTLCIILAIGIVILAFVGVWQNIRIDSLESEVHEYMETNNELWDSQMNLNKKTLEIWELQIELNELFAKWR